MWDGAGVDAWYCCVCIVLRMSEAREEDEPTTTDGDNHTAGDETTTNDKHSGGDTWGKKTNRLKFLVPLLLTGTAVVLYFTLV